MTGLNVPGSLNCTGPPSASATQTPQMAAWARDFNDGDMLCRWCFLLCFCSEAIYLKMSEDVVGSDSKREEPWKVGNL